MSSPPGPPEWYMRYVAFLRLMVQLEFFGAILAIALALMLVVPSPYMSIVITFCLLRLLTAHLNHRWVQQAGNVQDQYMLYPFF